MLFLFGVAYTIIVPPFQAPDEPAHFLRAYGVAEGQFILQDHPRELVAWFLQSAESYYDAEHIPILVTIRQLLAGDAPRIPNIAFNTSHYSFIPYLFHGAIIRIVMFLTSSPQDIFIALYACRVFTVLIYCLAVWVVAGIIPGLNGLIFWLAATPMALFQASIVSIDMLILGSGLCLLGAALKEMPLKSYSLWVIPSLFILLTTKPPYFPLALVLMVAVLLDTRQRLPKTLVLVTGGLAAFLAGMAWKQAVMRHGIYAHTMHQIRFYVSADIDPEQQMQLIMQAPWHLLVVFTNTLKQYGSRLLHEFTGIFGWLDVPLPGWMVVFWAIVLLLALNCATSPLSLGARNRKTIGLALVFSGALTITAILFVLYLVWMPVGATVIHAQGRYFHIPLLFILSGLVILFPVCRVGAKYTTIQNRLLPVAAAIINTSALLVISNHYYAFFTLRTASQ